MRTPSALPLLAALALGACSAGMPASAPGPVRAPTPAAAAEQDRLLVQNVSLVLVSDRPVEVATAAERLARGAGGHVESSIAREDRHVLMVLRVPAASLDSLLAALERLGEVEDRRTRVLDVTEETTDLEARLQNLVAVRNRLRQHLERAASVQDVIAVERELARVQAEIDALEARLTRLRGEVARATVTLELRRRRVLGPLGALLAGAGWVIEKLFVVR